MQTATYSLHEFFYDKSFYDYVNFSGVPYLLENKKQHSALVKELSQLDNGDGITFTVDQIAQYIPNLQSFPEFANSRLHFIDSPVFKIAYVNRQSLTIQDELMTVSAYEVEYDDTFVGEGFIFSGNFHLYSLQFYSENSKYFLRIRGYEET
jgi:hypothetical protein